MILLVMPCLGNSNTSGSRAIGDLNVLEVRMWSLKREPRSELVARDVAGFENSGNEYTGSSLAQALDLLLQSCLNPPFAHQC
jgi:hypothetical protein